jgi:hypothetical protein
MRSSSVSIGRPRGIGGSDSGSLKALVSPPGVPIFLPQEQKAVASLLREESSQQQKRSGRFRWIT